MNPVIPAATYPGILRTPTAPQDPTVATPAQREATQASDTHYAAHAHPVRDYDDVVLRRLARLTKRHGPLRAAQIMDKRGYWQTARRPAPHRLETTPGLAVTLTYDPRPFVDRLRRMFHADRPAR